MLLRSSTEFNGLARPRFEDATVAANMDKPPELTDAQKAKPLTHGDLEWMMEVIAEAINERVAAIPHVKYCGVWKPDTEYPENSLVTFKGSCFHGNVKTKGVEPGTSNAWTLMVKCGRDAPR